MRPAALILALLPLTAGAADPSLRWFTLEASHFRVHYHEGPGMPELAQRVARTCEAAHRALVPVMGWTPARKTEVVLTDDVDFANGSATAFHRPLMTLYADPPEELSSLNDHEDHLWDLIVHEYTHVLHLDNAQGPIAAVNSVFGKLVTPNAYVPRWMTEGLATYQESHLTAAGRLRSALFDMWLRSTFLEGAPFTLDQASHTPVEWPRASLAYLYGGRFLRYVAERVGEERLVRYFDDYGRRPIPWALNTVAEGQLGADFVTLYREWQEALAAQYRAQVAAIQAAGATPLVMLTRAGEDTGHAHFTADGQRLVYLERGPNRRRALRSVGVDGRDDRLELPLWTDVSFSLGPDGRRVVFSAGAAYRQFAVYEDLYQADLRTRRVTRLTHGLRASQPSYSPEGSRIAFVGRLGGGATYLGILSLRDGKVEQLLDAPLDRKLFGPVFSGDGRHLAFTQQSGYARELKLLELRTGEVRTVAGGNWMYLQPAFDAEGRIYVSSDRTGIYNIHVIDPRDGSSAQVTNVTTGVFHPAPSPDGQRLAVSAYSRRGTDVALLSMDRRFRGRTADRPPRPDRTFHDDPRIHFPVREYSALRTMVPQYWLPMLGSDPRGTAIGALTSGADLTDRYRYAASAGYGLASGEPSASLGVRAVVGWPSLELNGSTGIQQIPDQPRGLYDRSWAGSLSAGFPFTLLDTTASISAGYELRSFQPQVTARYSPGDPPPTIPRAGVTGALTVGWQISNVQRFATSISPEEGMSFGLGLRRADRQLGSTFDFSSAEARLQAYAPMPWVRGHVLALRLAGGAAVGDVGSRRVFAIGGISLQDPVLQLLRGERAGPGHLRGFPPGAFGGNSYLLGTLEYRFPLWDVQRGLFALPGFLRRLHGTVFADSGAVGDGTGLEKPRISLGGEARAELTLGYYLTTELRLGLARGLASEGTTDLYLSAGSSF